MNDPYKPLTCNREDCGYECAVELHRLKTDLLIQLQDEIIKRKVTKTELAALIGIKRENLSRILNNKTEPSLDMIYRIAHGLKLKLCVALNKE